MLHGQAGELKLGRLATLKSGLSRRVRSWRLTWVLIALWTWLIGWKFRLSHAMRRTASVDRLQLTPAPMPHVLIVCAHYNGSDWLRACVHSVIAQDYASWTLMLVDDASTDDSAEVIRELCGLDERIRGWTLAQNSGAYIARNTAIALANGLATANTASATSQSATGPAVPWTHVTLIDSDDIAAPDWLSHVLEVMGDDQGLVRCILERRDIDLIKTRRRIHSYCQTLYSRNLWTALGGFHPVRVEADDELLVRAYRWIYLHNATDLKPKFVSRRSWKTGQYMRSHDNNASDQHPIARQIWTVARRREIRSATTVEQLLLRPVEIVSAKQLIGIG